MNPIILALVSAAVFQSGDTLFFSSPGVLFDTIILARDVVTVDSQDIITSRKAKVAPDHGHYLIYTETYFRHNDSIVTDLAVYDAGQNLRWRESRAGGTKISYELTKIFDPFVALVVTVKDNTRPSLEFVDTRTLKRRGIISRGDWPVIVTWELSPDLRHLALYARKSVNGRTADYIYARDLETSRDWFYLFPICLSCKRGVISLLTDNRGQVDVKYKAEHRIFSSSGELIDFYMEDDKNSK
jgi:hypothetical protein